MQLNELLEKEGLESVSQKTNISVENLENLKNGVFEKLNRVKSLGFLNILEREYDLELDGLKEQIKTYFEDHRSAKDDEVVMISPERTEEAGSGLFKWLVALAVLYALWYLYSEGKVNTSLIKAESKETALEDHKALESNTSKVEANNVVVNTENKEEVILIDTEKKESDEAVEVAKVMETQEVIEKVVEENATNKESIDTKVIEEKQDSTVEDEKKKQEEGLSDKSVSADLQEKKTETPQNIHNLTINPTRGMLWYGFINVDSKKRREFMNNVSTPFELNNGRWILVTGHGFLEIVSDLGTVKVTENVRKKHYFYLDSNEIKEISRKEFRELNGNRGW